MSSRAVGTKSFTGTVGAEVARVLIAAERAKANAGG